MIQRVLVKNSLLTSMTYVIVNKSHTQNLANMAIYSMGDLSDLTDLQKVFFDGHLRNFEIVGL